MYTVEVKAIGGWTRHSVHATYSDAADQCDMVHGRIVDAVSAPRFDEIKHLLHPSSPRPEDSFRQLDETILDET